MTHFQRSESIELKGVEQARFGAKLVAAVVKGHHEVGAAASDSDSGCLDMQWSEPHCAARVLRVFSQFWGTIGLHAGLHNFTFQVLSPQY